MDIRDEFEEFEMVRSLINNLIASLLSKGIDPVMIAGVLLAAALRIYKAKLSPKQYDELLEAIEFDMHLPLTESDHDDPTVH